MKKIIFTLLLAIVSSVWNLNRASDSQISSLGDEWNVLVTKVGEATSLGFGKSYRTCHYYLKDDTIINSTHYTKAFYENEYIGALRENADDTSKVFGIPANHSHEYLIYDWSAQAGDTLQNYWVGYHFLDRLNVTDVIVLRSGTTKPRLISIQVGGFNKFDSEDTTHYVESYAIIEGVGVKPIIPLVGGPIMHRDMDDGEHTLLCAYKDGEQVYKSQESKYYGCYFENSIVTEALSGQWKLYKETIRSGSSSEKNTVTRDIDDDFLYIFTDSTLHITCPTCYSTPLAYGILGYNNGQAVIVVRGMFGTTTYDTITSPYSQLNIEKMTKNEIEWSFQEMYPENSYTNHHQYLRRYPQEQPYDTIPLYLVKDGPGTSTVDPADPNLIYAVLRTNMLIIRDFSGAEIFFTLSRNGSLFSPRRARSVQAQQSFTDSTSVELTEEGTDDIELTSESWNYIVVGSFDFNKTHEAVEIIPSERPSASKILRNGQLLIHIGDQLYTPSGVMVQ